MEKEFVPYELAAKLKELGFDEPCIAGYRDYNGIKLMTRLPNSTFPTVDSLGYGKYCKQNEHVVKAPLWQQAFDWFRDEHNFFMSLHIFNRLDFMFKVFTVYEDLGKALVYSSNYYPTYQEARQACLEKLIQLVEDENTRNNNK